MALRPDVTNAWPAVHLYPFIYRVSLQDDSLPFNRNNLFSSVRLAKSRSPAMLIKQSFRDKASYLFFGKNPWEGKDD